MAEIQELEEKRGGVPCNWKWPTTKLYRIPAFPGEPPAGNIVVPLKPGSNSIQLLVTEEMGEYKDMEPFWKWLQIPWMEVPQGWTRNISFGTDCSTWIYCPLSCLIQFSVGNYAVGKRRRMSELFSFRYIYLICLWKEGKLLPYGICKLAKSQTYYGGTEWMNLWLIAYWINYLLPLWNATRESFNLYAKGNFNMILVAEGAIYLCIVLVMGVLG